MEKLDVLAMVKAEFKKYQESNEYNQDQKNRRYSELMTILERKYDIPLLEPESHDFSSFGVSDEVMKCYKELSNARDWSIYDGEVIEDEDNWDIYLNAEGELFGVQRKNTTKALEQNPDMFTSICIRENVPADEMEEIIRKQ